MVSTSTAMFVAESRSPRASERRRGLAVAELLVADHGDRPP
jgi:hypothetical protein